MPSKARFAGGTVEGSDGKSIQYFAFFQGAIIRETLTDYSGGEANAIVQSDALHNPALLARLIEEANGH